jgi:hypothetical protein
VGDFAILKRALAAPPLDIYKLEEERRALPDRSGRPNLGLTAAFLASRAALEARQSQALARNAVLRDQFNAARLKLGMSPEDVSATFRVEPLSTGHVQAGEYRLYGSTESLNLTNDIHYANVLVLFEHDRVIGIYSGGLVPGGQQGITEMKKWFTELAAEDHSKRAQ